MARSPRRYTGDGHSPTAGDLGQRRDSPHQPTWSLQRRVSIGRSHATEYEQDRNRTAPRSIATTDGIRVRLDGFWTRPAHTIDLVAAGRHRLTLLLIPPETPSSAAHEAMKRAAHPDNTDTVANLFSSTCLPTRVPQPRE
ncbi:DUF5994 family protein [Lentzea sp. E54]|uniref:DUF5994 family protein n=1 Tax=Lentzea xerophila TaxID=3435883 RepID=UPI003DA3AEE5